MDNIAVHTFLACVCWISFKLSAFETICHEQRDINLSLCVVANLLFVNIQESYIEKQGSVLTCNVNGIRAP